jgi:uroporphyrinogen-III synthase
VTHSTTVPLILVTRPAGEADPLVPALLLAGYRVAAVPTVTTQAVTPGGPLDAAIAGLAQWDWIVVTSAAGARAVAEAIRRTGATVAHEIRWAAVGPATADALAGIGIEASVVPADWTGAAVGSAMAAADRLAGRRVLLARADAASENLPAALRQAGATVAEMTAYHTIEAPPASRVGVAAVLDDEGLAAVVVASGSAVRGLLRLAGDAGRDRQVRTVPLISIGPSTSKVARALGFERIVEARRSSVEALVEAVLETISLDRILTTTGGRNP